MHSINTLFNISHMGIDGWPRYTSSVDVNEMPNPITPYVRVLDGFNPSDMAIRIVASGGITSVLALPGSANVIGGEAYAFKLRPRSTVSNEDMLVQANNTEDIEWRWMKMACGENPKVISYIFIEKKVYILNSNIAYLRKPLTHATFHPFGHGISFTKRINQGSNIEARAR